MQQNALANRVQQTLCCVTSLAQIPRPHINLFLRPSSMASEELSSVLSRRQAINEGLEKGENIKPRLIVFNPFTEFPEFSRKEIKSYEQTFKRFDEGKDNFIDFEELKRMMEKLGAPQTHLALKEMITEVDEDKDSKISFREFLLIYRKTRNGELSADSGLGQLASLTEIDVDKAGVGGAKHFFEAKIDQIGRSKKFEEEIRAEQEQRKQELETRKERKKAFQEKALLFENFRID
uniref:EF-hand domain-containing protein n=1 Tax=Strigamia maritima TaxID=126957 RepID=T1JIJ1_STRMM